MLLENLRLDELGLVIIDFVDWVGDLVGIVVVDGLVYCSEVLVVDVLLVLVYIVIGGCVFFGSVMVIYFVYWGLVVVVVLDSVLCWVLEWLYGILSMV